MSHSDLTHSDLTLAVPSRVFPQEATSVAEFSPFESEVSLMRVEALPPDRHPAAVYLASLAPGSRRTMRHALDTVARLLTGGRSDALALDWGCLRYAHTTAVRAALAERYSPAMSNKTLAALRGVLKAAWRLGYIATDEYHRAVDIPAVKGSTLPAGRGLSAGELRALFAVCREDAKAFGARDAAMLGVLYGAGLRRSEVVALDLGDYDEENGTLRVRNGKGHQDRMGYIGAGSCRALEAWLSVRGDEPGPLFLALTKSGRLTGRRLDDTSVLAILRKRVKQAGIQRLSPHDLRRSCISDLLDAGADIATVQRLVGHANVTTTSRYDRRGEASKKKAAGLLHVPF